MNQNCSDYESEKCPKGKSISITVYEDNLKIGIVGCWGVYCQSDLITFYNYSLDEKKWTKDNLTIGDFFETENKKRGQSKMVEKLIKLEPYDSLFLAGDNVYEYSEMSSELKLDLEKRIEEWNQLENKSLEKFQSVFLTNKMIKNRRDSIRELYKNIDIKLQFSKGFKECFQNLDVSHYFLGLGNHDIETCSILNYQMNYSLDNKNYNVPATYYNVLYSDSKNNPLLNVFVLDTNLFEDEPKDCKGEDYSKDAINNQIEWFKKTLSDSNCDYNIVIGHIPYKAIGHKKSRSFIHNENLQPIFNIIKEKNKNAIKVQAYFCADEHDQQVLYDSNNKIYLVIVGSGGTTLDKIYGYDSEQNKLIDETLIQTLKDNKLTLEHANSEFGFSILNINFINKIMDIKIVDIKKELSYTLNKVL